jgi:hypothetical protein
MAWPLIDDPPPITSPRSSVIVPRKAQLHGESGASAKRVWPDLISSGSVAGSGKSGPASSNSTDPAAPPPTTTESYFIGPSLAGLSGARARSFRVFVIAANNGFRKCGACQALPYTSRIAELSR